MCNQQQIRPSKKKDKFIYYKHSRERIYYIALNCWILEACKYPVGSITPTPGGN